MELDNKIITAFNDFFTNYQYRTIREINWNPGVFIIPLGPIFLDVNRQRFLFRALLYMPTLGMIKTTEDFSDSYVWEEIDR